VLIGILNLLRILI